MTKTIQPLIIGRAPSEKLANALWGIELWYTQQLAPDKPLLAYYDQSISSSAPFALQEWMERYGGERITRWLNMRAPIWLPGYLNVSDYKAPAPKSAGLPFNGIGYMEDLLSLVINLPDTPGNLYLCLIRGIGGYAQTYSQVEGRALLSIVGDAVIDAIDNYPLVQGDSPDAAREVQAWQTRNEKVGALAHELLHGLLEGKDLAYWPPDQDGNAYGHSPRGAGLLSGDYGLWPNCRLDAWERETILGKGWV